MYYCDKYVLVQHMQLIKFEFNLHKRLEKKIKYNYFAHAQIVYVFLYAFSVCKYSFIYTYFDFFCDL